ncbi:hypothetical protein HPP92_013597 [Vanilla planifolia]|uniref:Potassium channel domain-containing protein n=1 Tax=Vanilla planifolia TaxID=51239 RepID=A0A835R2Q8_VANPL|nr:hypothetical protein HPP92_013597 [Vanilla planifolia]
MADNSAEQALLSRLTEPPERSQKMGTSKKRRYRRCKTAPFGNAPMDLDKDNGSSPVSSYIFKNFRPSFRLVFSLLALYLILGTTCFYFVRHQIVGKRTYAILDAVYFCIVTMTTVGYGDLVPDSAETKLLACAFVFSGMAIIALFLSKAADYLVEKQEVLLVKALHYRAKVASNSC